MCVRLPRGARPHAPWSARVVFVCAGWRKRDRGDAPLAGIGSPYPIAGPAGVVGGSEPPPEQLRSRPLLGPGPRGGASAEGPLEEGSLAGAGGGARLSSLAARAGGGPQEGPSPDYSRRAGTPSIGVGLLSHSHHS